MWSPYWEESKERCLVAMDTDKFIDTTGRGGERNRTSTAIILLAAGASIRMGRPKLLLTSGTRSFMRHAAEVAVASVCRPILVVLGAYASQLQTEIDDLPVQSVINERWDEGMGASIQAGMQALKTNDRAENTEAVVLMLCDHPYVTATVINDLVTAYHSNRKGIVASEYGGTLGAPALFGPEYFAELSALRGTTGAKHIIAAHPFDVAPVSFPKGITDIDTPEDYRKLLLAMLPQDPQGTSSIVR